jgi:hypothetical protein
VSIEPAGPDAGVYAVLKDYIAREKGGGGSWRRLPRVKIYEIMLNSAFKRYLTFFKNEIT